MKGRTIAKRVNSMYVRLADEQAKLQRLFPRVKHDNFGSDGDALSEAARNLATTLVWLDKLASMAPPSLEREASRDGPSWND